MSSPGEKLLGAEMLGALAITWISKVWANRSHALSLNFSGAPPPHEILGQVFLYSGLAFVAMLGDQPARLAAGVGGLVLLVIALKGAAGVFSATSSALPAVAQPGFSKQPTQGVLA